MSKIILTIIGICLMLLYYYWPQPPKQGYRPRQYNDDDIHGAGGTA